MLAEIYQAQVCSSVCLRCGFVFLMRLIPCRPVGNRFGVTGPFCRHIGGTKKQRKQRGQLTFQSVGGVLQVNRVAAGERTLVAYRRPAPKLTKWKAVRTLRMCCFSEKQSGRTDCRHCLQRFERFLRERGIFPVVHRSFS